MVQERIQVRLDWYLSELTSHLHRQAGRVFNSENKDAILEFIKQLVRQCSQQVTSNATLRSGLKTVEGVVVTFSRKVASPIVRELGRNSAASAGVGFVAGVVVSYAIFGGGGRSGRSAAAITSCPMKPQYINRTIGCKEPRDLKSFDGLEGLVIRENGAAPRIFRPDQVLIRVHAASVDPADISLLSGLGRYERSKAGQSQDRDNVVLGRDLSGTLVEVGNNVSGFNVGDHVWAVIPLLERNGALSDHVVIKEDLVRRKPVKVGHEGAATVPFSGIMAWKALHEAGVLPNATTKGKTVLVVEATSAVGCLAVQLVRTWGGTVVSVVSQRKLAPLAQMLGSSRVIVIENDDESERILDEELATTKLEAVLITANSTYSDLPTTFYQKYLKNPATSKVIVKAAVPDRLDSDSYGFLRRNLLMQMPGFVFRSEYVLNGKRTRECRVILDELKRLIDSGHVQPVLDSTCSVSQAEEAFQRTAAKSTIGKSIVAFVQ